MAITKTDFLNNTRCKRYLTLEKIEKEKLNRSISYEEYEKKETLEKIKEMFQEVIDSSDEMDTIKKHLEAMMPYYKQVEIEAAHLVEKYFGGSVLYAENTRDQKPFEFCENGIRYLCYVDIYNEKDTEINIIEVKATTSKKYLDLKVKNKSIWKKKKNIYYLKKELKDYPLEEEMDILEYEEKRKKLFDRYKLGEYIHDLAVQRMIIEGQYKEQKKESELKKIHYYLAVLNGSYIFDGTYEKGVPIYNKDQKGNEVITFFALDEITKEYQEKIQKEKEALETYLKKEDATPCPLGPYCGFKTQKECKYLKKVCAKCIPKKNSSLNYIQNRGGFTLPNGKKIKGLEMINEGYLHMLDIKEEWLTNRNHQIQRQCVLNHEEFIQKEKIEKALEKIEYPIYHLDFETFPCPLPRFKGEWPYIQSPFEFSLHIESAPGVCDKEKDNIVFLAQTTEDEREELIKTLLKYIDPEKGTLFAQNVSFEKGRIKELAHIFKEYETPLLKIEARGFDLLWLVNNKKELYEKLGFEKEACETINYYHENLSGSYSIKKTLPIFSELSYKNLEVKNGTDAIIEYARYDQMSKEELEEKKEALKIYCSQDTWAMVEILNALRKKVQKEIVN